MISLNSRLGDFWSRRHSSRLDSKGDFVAVWRYSEISDNLIQHGTATLREPGPLGWFIAKSILAPIGNWKGLSRSLWLLSEISFNIFQHQQHSDYVDHLISLQPQLISIWAFPHISQTSFCQSLSAKSFSDRRILSGTVRQVGGSVGWSGWRRGPGGVLLKKRSLRNQRSARSFWDPQWFRGAFYR